MTSPAPSSQDTTPVRRLTNKEIKQSLKYATVEGTAAAGMVGFSEQYVTPFALAASATQTQIGLLNSIPNLLTMLLTLKAHNLVEKIGSRKKTIMLLVFLDIFSVLPLLFVPLFVESNFIIWFGLLSFYFFFPPMLINPIWGNMMADIVPPKRMGRYFSRRSAMVGLSTLACSLTAAFILNHYADATLTGFTGIFGVAVLFRIASLLSYFKIHEPPMHRSEGQSFGFIDFIKESKSSSLVRFIIFICLMNFTLNLAGPFHAVYLIDTLKLSYPLYMVIINASAVATMITLAFWGRHADARGNVKVIKSSALLMPIAPVLWLVSGEPLFLVVAQLLAGFAWGGFNLCGPNYIYQASPKEKRGQYLAYFSAVNVAALSMGAMAGGFLSSLLPPIKGSSLLSLFLLTGIMRLGIALVFLPRLKETRFTREIKQPVLFYNTLSVSPQLRGVFHNPLAYKPIVAAAETYRLTQPSKYSLYNRIFRLMADTAAGTGSDPRFPHREPYRHSARKVTGGEGGATGPPPQVSPWTAFKRSTLGQDREASPIIGDDESIAEESRRHLARMKRQAAQPPPDIPAGQKQSLFYNEEMKKQMQRPAAPVGGNEVSPYALFRKRLASKRPEVSGEEKINRHGLYYRDIKPHELMKPKKKR